MKKLLQINPVARVSTSTGRIMQEIGELAMANGWESYIAYSYGRDGEKHSTSKLVPVGNRLDVAWHGLVTRLADRHGLASVGATKAFIAEIERIKPDIIHIHNIHGYFLNYRILFDYLAKCNIPVVWTVHDCWLYTGHCYHYSYVGCSKWQDECRECPQRRSFPASWFVDRSNRNFHYKRNAFTSIPAGMFTIVPVSGWIKGEMERSFLKECSFRVIHNGIDTSLFTVHDPAGVKRRYGLEGKHVILAVASIWCEEKGWNDLLSLAARLNDGEVLVMVGVNEKQQAMLPANVVGISRTENIGQLAELYSAADVFVNPTWQDNYPTVNLEAIACGTPVVTYRTGGSVEAVTEATGIVVEQGDTAALLRAVRLVEDRGKAFYQQACRDYALEHFRKEDRYADYLRLYDELIAHRGV